MKLFVVEMPFNEDGNGPEMDTDKIVSIDYQVWDIDYICRGSFDTRQEAEAYAEAHG